MKKLLYLTIFIFALLIAKNANAGIIIRPVIHSGLVGYWDFQEGAGSTANDHSGSRNHGTLTNMDENDWVDGKLGKALEFDGGDDFVDTGSDSSLDNVFLSGGTISAWIYQTAWTATTNYIYNKDDGAGDYIDFMWTHNSNHNLYFKQDFTVQDDE